jgi:hypothetical protein
MNGASALLSARIRSTPKIRIMVKRGSSQNFFRTRRNFQNSAKKDISLILSELIPHVGQILAGVALNPIGRRILVFREAQEVLAHPAKNGRNGGKDQVKQDPRYDRVYDPAEEDSELGPYAV